MGNIRAKKALGQNFLVDGNVIVNIVHAAHVGGDENVLEVGPGRGALTTLLAEKAAQVVAVEWDRDLVPLLQEGVGSKANVEIFHGDILRVDLPGVLTPVRQGQWKVVANLPYNISSQVLFTFIENRSLFSELLLMLQKEVGERLLAQPSSKEYGVLTVLCRLVFDIEKVFLVKPSSFRPIPKVDSLVLRFRVLPANRLDVGDDKLFRILVKASFSQRRKTLWNCLRSLDFLNEPELLEKVFDTSGIDRTRRGETLSLQEFADLTKTILQLRNEGALLVEF